ncbi:MAG: phosphatase PAP2 family protein [Chitinophagaceae bacterium]|nr:phosphatase PAP2 family protein [Chitinophagaceae bacterium]
MREKSAYLGLAGSIVAFLLCSEIPYAQQTVDFNHATSKISSVEKWKPIILSDVTEITVTAPPGRDQSMAEAAEVKARMSRANEDIREQIRYWDAGAPAYRWNELAGNIVNFEDINAFFRFPASWMNMAIYDATLVAWKAKYQYNRKRPFEANPAIKPLVMSPATPSYPCEHTVTAAAAANVLAYFYPKQGDSIIALAKQASQSRIYAGLQYPSDVEAAWKLGEQVARKIIEKSKSHQADVVFKGTIPKKPNRWYGDYPVGIQVKDYKPIIMQSAAQFRPPAPPDFSKDMSEMKNFKQDFRSNYLALRWASLSGIDFWNELAGKKIFEEHLDGYTPQCARIYALLNTAMYDAGITIMDAKYAYWGIRPFQYDSTFQPLIFTPPFPGYPSGHATASSVAASVLSYFFPDDKNYFKKMAEECAESRFYAGIHFRTDNETGLQVGERLAAYIIDEWNRRDKLASR